MTDAEDIERELIAGHRAELVVAGISQAIADDIRTPAEMLLAHAVVREFGPVEAMIVDGLAMYRGLRH